MRIAKNITFKGFIAMINTGLIKDITEVVKSSYKPNKVGKKVMPDDLKRMTLQQMSDLRGAGNDIAYIYNSLSILYGLTNEDINKSKAVEVLGLCEWTKKELESVNKYFDSIKTRYSSEELSAGVKNLDFGFYGMADAYARRMGITNPDDVMSSEPWIKIWNAMRIDGEIAKYQKRLQDIYFKKQRR